MVLPERPSDVLLKDTRYGDVVLNIADVFRHKTQIHEYKLALFGGSTTLYNASASSVGSRNVTYMRYVVENVMKCSLSSEDTGGTRHRRLHIDGINGRFRVSLLNKRIHLTTEGVMNKPIQILVVDDSTLALRHYSC